MSYINFNPTASNGFQNALNMGLQFGARASEAANRRGFNNALAGYNPNNPDSFKEVAKYDPRVAIQLRKESQAQQAQTQNDEIARRAIAGDPEATQELFVRNPDLWTKLDKNQQEQTKAATSLMGQAALQIGRLPEEQRAAAWARAVQQAEASGIDIPAYAESYSPEALNNVVARAGIMEKYINQFEPNYRVIPEGGTLVDTNNPQAVGQFAPPSAIPPLPPGFTLDGDASGNAGGGF